MRNGRLLSRAAAGALAGMAAGLMAGIGARVAMRMVADGVADGVMARPDFTVGGTLVILFIGTVVGAPLGVLYDTVADRIPGPPKVHGLVFGALALATLGPLFFFLAREELFSQGRVVLFAILFPIYGIALGLALAPSRRLGPRLPVPAQAGLALASVASAAFVVFGILSTLVGDALTM